MEEHENLDVPNIVDFCKKCGKCKNEEEKYQSIDFCRGKFCWQKIIVCNKIKKILFANTSLENIKIVDRKGTEIYE